jgi:hypothetical protein
LTGAVVTHSGVGGRDAEDLGGIGEGETINGDEFEDGTLSLGHASQRIEQCTGISFRVDPGGKAFGRVVIEPQLTAETGGRSGGSASRSVVASDHVSSDAVQPRRRGATVDAKSMAGRDRLEENIGGQVSRVLRAGDPSGDEPLDLLDVRSVERIERIGVVTDIGNDRGYVHTLSSPMGLEALRYQRQYRLGSCCPVPSDDQQTRASEHQERALCPESM